MNLKTRAISIWGADNVKTVAPEHLRHSGLSPKAIETITEVGFPIWCAPNIHLDLKDGFKKDDGVTDNIHIGTDRNERLICLNRNTENIGAMDFDGCFFSIANNLSEFLDLLMVYADFVETYISEHAGFNFGTTFPNSNGIAELIEKLENTCPDLRQKHSWWEMHFKNLINKNPNYFK